jgi:hypothetical protein
MNDTTPTTGASDLLVRQAASQQLIGPREAFRLLLRANVERQAAQDVVDGADVNWPNVARARIVWLGRGGRVTEASLVADLRRAGFGDELIAGVLGRPTRKVIR